MPLSVLHDVVSSNLTRVPTVLRRGPRQHRLKSTVGPGAVKNRGFAFGDFALELCKRFDAAKSLGLQGVFFEQLAAKGMGEVRRLVAVQVLPSAAPVFDALACFP